MKTSMTAALIFASIAGFAGAANADLVNGTITADNHYALYSSQGNVFSYHGGNEITSGGNPGTYNWSQAEPYQFEVGEFLYIAAWSDDSVAQGVLAEFHSDALGTLMSGDSRCSGSRSSSATPTACNPGGPSPESLTTPTGCGAATSVMLIRSTADPATAKCSSSARTSPRPDPRRSSASGVSPSSGVAADS